ncbi:AbrB/MazE/SpoVT family DNA-binding domain-containing protein [Streptomyces sp. NPDC092296]|uniref:AbrB/MazE/SpoVT family DNA-binding domain-containing protein n=1 Tax=Streptomyces sp. NPDC092296 TaxID=3366012 RepID=UPI0037F7DA83
MAEKVKRVRCTTKISSKNQVTLPVSALRGAHLEPGDRLRVEADGEGRLLLVREADPLDRVIGAFPGLSAASDLEAERDAWER